MGRPQRVQQKKKHILFLVEGDTEKYFIKGLMKYLNFRIPHDIESMNGGGYINFKNYIQRNSLISDIIIAVCDLDKAAANDSERAILERVISFLEKENIKNTLFLTFKNSETLFEVGTQCPSNCDIYEYLGYRNTKKGQEDIFEKLIAKNFSLDEIRKQFKNVSLYYSKDDITKKGQILRENIDKHQSNFSYFKEYIEKIFKSLD